MTKKHFISLADSIRIYNRFASEPFTERQISELADFCKEQNGNFNRERWLGYIAGENGKNGGAVKPLTHDQKMEVLARRWQEQDEAEKAS